VGEIYGARLGIVIPWSVFYIRCIRDETYLSDRIGLQDKSDATIETLKAIDHPISKTAQIIVEACAFAGTGNVLKIQAMLHHCDEHIVDKKEDPKNEKDEKKEEEPKKDDTFQAFSVLAVALIAMGEDIGAEMSLRQFNHLVRGPVHGKDKWTHL